jgi:hypothetical protein
MEKKEEKEVKPTVTHLLVEKEKPLPEKEQDKDPTDAERKDGWAIYGVII